MNFNHFRVVLFDWGNTLMQDNPSQTAPMVDWGQVHMVGGADVLLEGLRARGLRLVLATGAKVSDELQIRAALARVQLDEYLERIYCHHNTGLLKPSREFYQYILDDLGITPAEALMVGDSFESDVMAANRLGIAAVWFNPLNTGKKDAELISTVHHLPDLLERFDLSV